MTTTGDTPSRGRNLLYFGLIGAFGLLFFVAGVGHFVRPEPFVRIVPPAFANALGGAHFLVYASGVAEVVGAALLVIPKTRSVGTWFLIALLAAVFPANIYMALEGVQIDPNAPMPVWMMWARLPLQFLAAGALWFVGKETRSRRD